MSPLAPIFPTPGTLVGDLGKYAFTPALIAWVEIKKHLHEWSPDGRMERVRDELMNEFWSEMWTALRSHEEQLRQQGAAFRELQHDLANRFQDHEALGVFANLCEDAYCEPLDARRRMMAHAAAGLADAGLSVAEYARVWRVLREVDPGDIGTLFALWLVPSRAMPALSAPEELRFQELNRRGGDALEGCNAVVVRTRAGAGIGGRQFLEITRTGYLLLKALRTFIATRPLPTDVPGHALPGMRDESDARNLIASHPILGALAARYRNHDFGAWAVLFHGVGPNADASTKARIVLRRVSEEDATALRAELPGSSGGFGQLASELTLDDCRISHEDPELHEVHIGGPFDVLRWLAYDLNANWS